MRIDKAERICAFCEKAEALCDEENMLCRKNGVVPKRYTCRSFSYDPLKRLPPKTCSVPKLEFVDIEN